MEKDLLDLPLDDKLVLAKNLLARAMDRFGDAFRLAWTGGKDSTLVLWLARELGRETGRAMPRVLVIDEGDPFPEIVAFQKHLTEAWGLDVQTAANREILDAEPALGDYIDLSRLSQDARDAASRLGFTGPGFPFDPDSPLGAQLLKALPLHAFLREHGVAALATGIRWDEHPAREDESHESPRPDPPHWRIHPILHLREADVWAATRGRGLPFCELYAKGYRSLGTRNGSARTSDLPAWEQDLAKPGGERAGRAREKEDAMAGLRALGYM